MRDQIDVLLDKVDDPALRDALRAEIDRVRAKRSFGLVFESHLPERVRLPDHELWVGGTVVWRADPESPTFEVAHLDGDNVTMRIVRDSDGSSLGPDDPRREETVAAVRREVVVIADFGAPIHPGLRHVGSVHRGGDEPSHVVIKGENHHALEALQFTHAGKVDCIYIDPPYNTGARDWMYDNDYVDDSDAYRHSKWLAFMERRLLLAKQLLNPDDSVLIVTIDENELHRLGLLLAQCFSGRRIQLVSTVINPRGRFRDGEFSQCNEFALFVFVGSARVLGERDNDYPEGAAISWRTLRRSDITSARGTAKGGPNQFYPIYVNVELGTVDSVGEPLLLREVREEVARRTGCVAVFPVRDDGTEMNWGLTPESLRPLIGLGYVKVGAANPSKPQPYQIGYLTSGRIEDIVSGRARVTGRDASGAVIAEYVTHKVRMPLTAWDRPSHNAETGGTNLIKSLLGIKAFDYPKSLYAVEDAIRLFVKDKPSAVVLDFFAGSGTTAHAVARLNRQDGGNRQAILVTNNEVSGDEAKAMRERGLFPGDPEWEALGIFEHVTRPRVTAAITGLTPDGEPVKGDYKYTDEFPMAEGFEQNVDFLELTYLDPGDVELDLSFAGLAPLLWMRAGAQGPIIEELDEATGTRPPYAWTDRYGVLFDPDRWRAFVAARPATATSAFIVTDSTSTFAGVASELPDSMDVVRLYESYLTAFAATGVR